MGYLAVNPCIGVMYIALEGIKESMKYFIMPFGCQMNLSDTERIRTVLNAMGYSESDDEHHPDVIIKGIVACSVRQKAIDRVYGRIRNWNASKTSRPVLTFISGCILPADREKFLKLFDLVFPIEQLPELPDMIRQYGVPTPGSLGGAGEERVEDLSPAPSGVSKKISPFNIPAHISAPDPDKTGGRETEKKIENFWKVEPSYSSGVEAFVPIQNGCDKFCTYCAVPYTRGREVSRPSGDILEEVRSLVEKGCRSITLLGQNVNSYGLDKKGKEISFPRLMRAVGEIGLKSGADFWTYFTSPHPRDINRELLEVMAEYPVLAKWIHLPLQSGDDEVLSRMNRNYSMDRYRSVVNDIRRILPDASLFTDIIVGFNGETAEQFENTAAAMEEFRYDMAFIAKYSPRPGAKSAEWEDDVSRQEKERRFRRLGKLLQQYAAPRNQSRVGKVERVLINAVNEKKGYFSGYSQGRIPVRIPFRIPAGRKGGERREGEKAEAVSVNKIVGRFVNAEITSARPLSIEGRLLQGEEPK